MDEYIRATTRIPNDVAEWLKSKAKAQSRSMNGQLIECLKKLMQEDDVSQKQKSLKRGNA